jgi:hypothetical protein
VFLSKHRLLSTSPILNTNPHNKGKQYNISIGTKQMQLQTEILMLEADFKYTIAMEESKKLNVINNK